MYKIYDTIGIGFGPANIAIAIAMEELEFKGSAKFFDAKKDSTWQECMLLENSDIQNHPLRDLVTPRNPRSKYSFTNFLFENNRLYEYLNTGFYFPLRLEYNQYITWVAQHFSHLVQYNTLIKKVEFIKEYHGENDLYKITDSNSESYYSRTLIIAPGRTPNIPIEFQNVNSNRIIHLTTYLQSLRDLHSTTLNKIAVIGGSQSAVEIILDLSERFPDSEITGFTKAYGFKQKDVNPFTGEVYFPYFVQLFYNSDDSTKKRLISDLHLTNYSASDADVLDQLYRRMYKQKLLDRQKIFIERSSNIFKVTTELNEKITLHYNKIESEKPIKRSFDLIILATGFKNLGTNSNEERYPEILSEVLPYIDIQDNDHLRINYDYSIPFKDNNVNTCFLNGLCESSHGMGDAGSFSLLSLRAGDIINAIMNKLKTNKSICYEQYN